MIFKMGLTLFVNHSIINTVKKQKTKNKMKEQARKDWAGVTDKAGNKYYMIVNDNCIDIVAQDCSIYFSLPRDFPVEQITVTIKIYVAAIERGIEIGKSSVLLAETEKGKTITIQDGECTLYLDQVVRVIWDHPRQSADAIIFTGEDYTCEDEDYHNLVEGLRLIGWDIGQE